MPQVRFAPAALHDLQRLREFLRPKNPAAAKRAAAAIVKSIQVLAQHPQVGRPIDNLDAEFRELIIDFGDSGYVARYRFSGDLVVVVAVRHQKEMRF